MPRQCSSEVAVVAVVAGYGKRNQELTTEPKFRRCATMWVCTPKSSRWFVMVHSSMTHSRWWWLLDRCLQWTEGWRLLPWPHLASCPGRGRILVGHRILRLFGQPQITKGSVSYLSSPCFSTSLGGIGGPAHGIHGILAVMCWISIIRGGGAPPPKMVLGSIPTGDAVTGPHIRGTLSMREMSL